MLKRLIVLPLMLSLTACSTMSVKNDGETVTATVTRPVLFNSMEEAAGKVSETTREMLEDICKGNHPRNEDETASGRSEKSLAEALVVTKSFVAALGATLKILPSLSYSATIRCPPKK